MPERAAWSFITLGDERQYGGNTGYADDVRTVYRFDSSVANHKQVAAGDLAFIRDGHRLLGVAQIKSIAATPGTKERRRCPVCRSPHIKLRKSRSPAWRCKSGHEFNEPVAENVPVQTYSAHFGDTFVDAPHHVSASRLKSAAAKPNDQLSIERLDIRQLPVDLSSAEAINALLVNWAETRVPDPSAGDGDGGNLPKSGYVPNPLDRREAIMAAIKRRRGQTKFRKNLIRAYGPHCLISGCGLLDIVEAAHIWPYRGEEDHHVENGLLLRSDLHTLFDLGLLAVHPSKFTVHLKPRAQVGDYAALHGLELKLTGKHRPAAAALDARWQAFESD